MLNLRFWIVVARTMDEYHCFLRNATILKAVSWDSFQIGCRQIIHRLVYFLRIPGIGKIIWKFCLIESQLLHVLYQNQ